MAVTAFEIATRVPVLDGRPFGAAGAYEKLAGTLRFAADPAAPVNRAIADLDRAERNAAGRVEFWADFYVLKPVDMARGNGALLLDSPNRGRKVALGMLNSAARANDPVTAADFGNGFLMRHGFTVAWVGWQQDVPRQDNMMSLGGPRVRGVSGRVRCEFRPNVATEVLPLADRYHIPHPVADVDDPEAALTVREHAGAPAVAIPRARWRFPDPAHVRLEGGFAPGHLYDCYYRAGDPPVAGLAFLAFRDSAAFLRFGAAPGNPCAGGLARAYAFGVSQSGRFLRHLLHLALNEDEAGRDVFDVVIPHVAGARRGEFNLRFGQPSLNAYHSVGSLFPFTDGEQLDPVTGQRGALLGRLTGAGRRPKVVTINTAAEYWRGDGSLVHTDVEARADAPEAPGTRFYLLAGAQHTPSLTIPPAREDANTGGRALQRFDVLDYAPLLRACLVAVDRWARDGVEPPPSAVPRVADGTAVPHETTAGVFRAIPGVRFPDRIERPVRLDFGPDVERGVASELPPKVGAPYATVVSAVDADGNDRAGLRGPELLVPLATLTGWNLRHPDQGAPGDLIAMQGSTLPFPRTAEERAQRGDPRASIAERYASRAAYLQQVRDAATGLVAHRHLLDEDVDAVVERAGRLWDWIQAGAPA
jgi:hypothetical protein